MMQIMSLQSLLMGKRVAHQTVKKNSDKFD
jgi:hypothetical protein